MQHPVVALPDHRDRVALVIGDARARRHPDHDHGAAERDRVSLLDVDQHGVRAGPVEARVVEDPAHHAGEGVARARAGPGVRDDEPDGADRGHCRQVVGAQVADDHDPEDLLVVAREVRGRLRARVLGEEQRERAHDHEYARRLHETRDYPVDSD